MSSINAQPRRTFAELSSAEQAEAIAYLQGVVAALIGERLRDVSQPGKGLASHEALTACSRFSLLDDPLLRVSPRCMED